MNINERIKEIRRIVFNNSTKDFATALNVSSQAVSNYVRNGYNVGREVIENILKISPSVDSNWLLTGEGEMLKDQSNVKLSGSYISENLIDVTHVTLKTYASFIESLYDCEPKLETYKIIPEDGDDFENEDYIVFDVEGESMYPTIQSGSKILCKKIKENQWEYARGIVVAVYGKTLTVKRILKNDLYINNLLILKADNPTYGEVEVERCEIRGVWQAVRVVSMDLR